MLPLPSSAPPGADSAPLPSNPRAISTSVWSTPPAPPAVSSASSVTNPSNSSPIHLEVFSALSSRSVPSTRYFPHALLLHCLNCGYSIAIFFLISRAAIVDVAAVFLLTTPALLHVSPPPSLFLPLAPLHPPPSPIRLLHPPRAHHPPALATNIVCKDKDVGNQTGGGEAHGSVVGGSVPCRKGLNRTLTVVGYGISRNLFLHWPQQ